MEVPFTEYNLDSAFEKAQTELAEDIMIPTADFILKWYEELKLLFGTMDTFKFIHMFANSIETG